MATQRNLQLGAAAALVNTLLVLASASPGAEVADACPIRTGAGACYGPAYCQSVAPPGCKFTNLVCTASQPVITVCYYE